VVAVAICTACGPAAEPSPSFVTAEELNGPWLPAPLAIDAANIAGVERLCREAFAVAADLPVRHPDMVEGAPLALVDVRGAGIAHAVFGALDESGGLCWNGEIMRNAGPRRAGVAELLLSWVEWERLAATELCPLALLPHWFGRDPSTVFPGHEPPQHAFSIAGRAGGDVASVFIDVPGLGDVTPTFQDGLFVAWWPGPIDGFTVVGLDASGERVVEMPSSDPLRSCSS
jgi:hypothetical protein